MILRVQNKTHWNDEELIRVLRNDIANAMLDGDRNTKYDGLIACISCHGIKNKIITSNEKLVDKTLIHRLVLMDNPEIREIPRLFLFDSCESDDEQIENADKSDVGKNESGQHNSAMIDDLMNVKKQWTEDSKKSRL